VYLYLTTMTSKGVLVFDFDGTIADTINPLIRIINGLADEFSFRKISSDDVHILKNKSTKEIISYLNMPILRLPLIVRRIRYEMNREIPTLNPIVDMKHVLISLKQYGYSLGILTTNSRDNVVIFLNRNGMDIFDFIRSTHHLFGKHIVLKGIKRVHAKRGFRHVFYVGDEVRDVEAGRKAKVSTVAVTWGLNSKERLLKAYPDYIVEEPEELEGIFSILAYVSRAQVRKMVKG